MMKKIISHSTLSFILFTGWQCTSEPVQQQTTPVATSLSRVEKQPPVADWADVVDLNYGNHDLRAAMIEAMQFWVREADIDGYRCDVAGMVPLDFWRAARAALDAIKPVFLLAEGEEPQLHDAFDMTYSWELHHLMNKVAKGEKNANDIDRYKTDHKAGKW